MAVPLILPLARVAIPAITAFALGYVLRNEEAEAEKVAGPDKFILAESVARQALYKRGKALLNELSTNRQQQDISEFLSDTYLALYCIGRSETQLSVSYIAELSLRLAHIHAQCRARGSKQIALWHQTSGTGEEDDLAVLLRNFTPVRKLELDTRYMAYALRAYAGSLYFDNTIEELVEKL